MSQETSVDGGGKVEQTLFMMAGFVMGVLGAFMAWLCYSWAVSDVYDEYKWLWVTGSGGLAFFMLRGAWFTLVPKKKVKKVRFNTGGR